MERSRGGRIGSEFDAKIVFHGPNASVIVNVEFSLTKVLDHGNNGGVIVAADDSIVNPKKKDTVVTKEKTGINR
jgi:hypothetical protein